MHSFVGRPSTALMLGEKVLLSLLLVALTPLLGYGILANQVFKLSKTYIVECSLSLFLSLSFIYIKVLDLVGTLTPVFQFSSHTSWISACKWHNKSWFHLLSASYDGKVMLWDLRTAVLYFLDFYYICCGPCYHIRLILKYTLLFQWPLAVIDSHNNKVTHFSFCVYCCPHRNKLRFHWMWWSLLHYSGIMCWLVERWFCGQWWGRLKALYFFRNPCAVR